MSSQQCCNFALENKKEVFEHRSDRYKFEFVLRAKAVPFFGRHIRMMSHHRYRD